MFSLLFYQSDTFPSLSPPFLFAFAVGQSVADWHRGMGHWLRADFQPPRGQRGHCSGHLLVPDRLGGADWGDEAPSGVAFLCILFKKGFSPS